MTFAAYLLALAFATVLCGTAALFLWHRRETPGATPLSFSLAGAAAWCAAAFHNAPKSTASSAA